MSRTKTLLSKDSARDLFHGLVISRQRGDLFLLPIHEITWLTATPLPQGGMVEIHTRQRIIRLGLTRMDACHRFVEMLFKNLISHVTEGTGPLEADRASESDREKPKATDVTLVVEIIDLDDNGTTTGQAGSPPPPNAPVPQDGTRFGFPTTRPSRGI